MAWGLIKYRGKFRGWDSAVGTATGYGQDDRGVGVLVPVEAHFPDRLWGSTCLLSNEYRGLFLRGKAAGP
jgi:hypothetical protein